MYFMLIIDFDNGGMKEKKRRVLPDFCTKSRHQETWVDRAQHTILLVINFLSTQISSWIHNGILLSIKMAEIRRKVSSELLPEERSPYGLKLMRKIVLRIQHFVERKKNWNASLIRAHMWLSLEISIYLHNWKKPFVNKENWQVVFKIRLIKVQNCWLNVKITLQKCCSRSVLSSKSLHYAWSRNLIWVNLMKYFFKNLKIPPSFHDC